MKIDWKAVLRDALGVLLLGFLGRVVGGWIGGEADDGIQGVSAIILMTAGFCASGCLARQARFKHLALVAVGVWLIGVLVSGISSGGGFAWPLGGLALIVGAMLLGGLVSLAIVRTPPAAPPPAAPPPAAPPPGGPPPAAPPPGGPPPA